MENASLDALFCLFKGEWGTRKSTAALSFPKPQYWFSFDQKMESLIMPIKKWGIDEKLIEYDDYNDWNKAEKKLEQLQLKCPFKTVVVDTLGKMGDAVNSQTLKVKSGTTKVDGGEKGARIAGIAVNSIEDYKAETAAFQTLMRNLKDIHKYHKVNIILIGHVMRETEEIDGRTTHVSRIIVVGARKMAFKIPGDCHEVYHFNMKGDFSGEKKYSLLTTHSGADFARTALPLEKEIVFENKPLYDQWIVPAIANLKTMPRELPQKF